MNYKGVIIEESLEDKSVLNDVKISGTEIEKVTEEHKTPWIDNWTLHNVEIPEEKGEEIADKISRALDSEHSWYADFKNDDIHYIVFRGKFFRIDRNESSQYDDAVRFGISLGIPSYQLDFSPHIEEWSRDHS